MFPWLQPQQQSFQEQQKFHAQEDAIARELQKRKLEEESKKREIEKVFANSEELKELKQKISIGLVAKERTKQMTEKQMRRFAELKQDIDLEDTILRKVEEEQRMDQEKLDKRKQKMYQGKDVLKTQMQERQLAELEAKEQYVLEKEQVDRIMQSIIDEDKQAYEVGCFKKKRAFQDMVETLEDKARRVQVQKDFEKSENEKYKLFYAQKDKMEADIKEKRLEEDRKKQALFEQLKEAEQRRREEKEQLENLRMELYKEEWDANERKKENDENLKRLRQMKEMQDAEREHKEYKQYVQQQELAQEQEFRRQMMAKFADDEKLEQMTQQKRRMKEFEHKKEVERLWQEKLSMYKQARDAELEERAKDDEKEKWKDELVKQEKQRLLQQYGPQIDGYLPKGLLKTQQETQYLPNQGRGTKTNYGQSFKIY